MHMRKKKKKHNPPETGLFRQHPAIYRLFLIFAYLFHFENFTFATWALAVQDIVINLIGTKPKVISTCLDLGTLHLHVHP